MLPLFLALSGTANAALLRVSAESPLAPVSPVAWNAAPSALSVPAAPLDFGAVPAPLALPAALPAPAMPVPQAEAAAALRILAVSADAAAEGSGPKAKDSPAPNESSEDSVQALESVFDQAAKPAGEAPEPLLARLLQHVRLDDGGVPERREALTRALTRMLETPTARALAERFIAAGVPASIRLEAFEGSRIHEVDGRKIFYAPRAFTEWKGDHLEVRLNLDYLGTSPEFLEQDLPPTIAHELLGHGLWYPLAARGDVLEAFHYHDLNEANARVVGWLVDFEMDQRFEEGAPWSYMRDPAGFMSYLKLRLPYYALTWSTEELARPRETLEERSLAAQSKRDDLRRTLSNHRSWNQVIDHFVNVHRVAKKRLVALRAYMDETTKSYEDEIAVMDSLIAAVDEMARLLNQGPGRDSEDYLRRAAAHPLFADLRTETDENTRRLIEQVNRTTAQLNDESPSILKARADHWRGQITFDELVEMYKKDKKKNPSHWLP